MVFIVENRVVVSVHSNSVGEHLFLVVKKSVCAEVVGEVDFFVHGTPAIAGGCTPFGGGTVSCAPHQDMAFESLAERQRDRHTHIWKYGTFD